MASMAASARRPDLRGNKTRPRDRSAARRNIATTAPFPSASALTIEWRRRETWVGITIPAAESIQGVAVVAAVFFFFGSYFL